MGSAILTLILRRSPSSSSSSKTSTVVQSCCDPGHHLHSSLQFSQRGLEFTMRLLCVAVLLITFTIEVHAKKKSACSFKRGDCASRAKTACTDVLNGYGMCHDEVCDGREVAHWAFVKKPHMCKCCFPLSPCDGSSEGCPEGYFKTSGSNRCYKFLGDLRRTWAEADQECKSQNLVLAMTDDNAVELTSYIMDTYGPSTTTWLGAKSDGSVFRWEQTNDIIPDSSLWFDYSATSGRCLMLLTHSWYADDSPNAPFIDYDCTATRYTLCEKV